MLTSHAGNFKLSWKRLQLAFRIKRFDPAYLHHLKGNFLAFRKEARFCYAAIVTMSSPPAELLKESILKSMCRDL